MNLAERVIRQLHNYRCNREWEVLMRRYGIEVKEIVDCSECIYYGELECLDCERADLFEKRSNAE